VLALLVSLALEGKVIAPNVQPENIKANRAGICAGSVNLEDSAALLDWPPRSAQIIAQRVSFAQKEVAMLLRIHARKGSFVPKDPPGLSQLNQARSTICQ
jgi:hypothetical protein